MHKSLALGFTALASAAPASKRYCGTVPYGLASPFTLAATSVNETGHPLSSGLPLRLNQLASTVSLVGNAQFLGTTTFTVDGGLIADASGAFGGYESFPTQAGEYLAFGNTTTDSAGLYALATGKCTGDAHLWITDVDGLGDPELIDPWFFCDTGAGYSAIEYGYGVATIPIGCERVGLEVVGFVPE